MVWLLLFLMSGDGTAFPVGQHRETPEALNNAHFPELSCIGKVTIK